MSVRTRRVATMVAAAGLLLVTGSVQAQRPGAPNPGGWARVDADGSLGANTNVVRVNHIKTGIYRVVFNQDVSHCAGNATLAAHNGRSSIVPGYIVVGRNDNFPEQMRVYTFQTVTLLPTDFRFDLLVTC